MTIKRIMALAAITLFGVPLTGCGLLVPLAVAAVEAAPEIIEEIGAARRSVPPVQVEPAVRLPALRQPDDAPLIEPDDVSP